MQVSPLFSSVFLDVLQLLAYLSVACFYVLINFYVYIVVYVKV